MRNATTLVANKDASRSEVDDDAISSNHLCDALTTVDSVWGQGAKASDKLRNDALECFLSKTVKCQSGSYGDIITWRWLNIHKLSRSMQLRWGNWRHFQWRYKDCQGLPWRGKFCSCQLQSFRENHKQYNKEHQLVDWLYFAPEPQQEFVAHKMYARLAPFSQNACTY